MNGVAASPAIRKNTSIRVMGRLVPIRINLLEAILLLLTLVAGSLVSIWAKSSVLHERYLLEEVQKEQARLQMENRALRLEWATLTSPEVLEEAARKRFHLRHPGPKDVVRLP